MKKILATALVLVGCSASIQAQKLLYEWNFTNTVTTTLTSSVPSYAAVPGTGDLFMKNGQGTTAIGVNAYFTNGPGAGPGSGPGGSAQGALVLTNQGYNGNNNLGQNSGAAAVTLATNVNIGQRIKFTVTFWFQLGTSAGVANNGANTFPRLLMLGAGTGYDSGSANTGVGVGASLNNWVASTDPTANGTFFASSIQNGNGNNSGAISARLPSQFNLPTEIGTFTNGIRASDFAMTNDNQWYFQAMTFDGTLASGHFKSWLGTLTTNVVLVDSQNAPANMLPQPNFTTNAVLFLANRNGGTRAITDGKIADVRIYAGLCSSNNLEAIRTFTTNFVDDGSGDDNTPPVIQKQPLSGSTLVGLSRGFSVEVTGLKPLAYQWKTNSVSVPGATNATFTLNGVPLSLNGAAITCTITNLLGSSNSAPAILTVLQPPAGSYAAAVLAQNPFIYWHVNETTNGAPDPSVPLRVYDYASGLDGSAVDPLNMTFNVTGLGALLYPGFDSANHAIQVRNNGNFSRMNMAALPRYTNDMTLCGWILAPATPGSYGIIYSMNGGNNGYSGANNVGFGYGLWFNGSALDANGNLGGQLSYNWRVDGFTGPGNPAIPFTSSLVVPANEWTFIALTIDPDGTNATLYMGSHSGGLQVSVDDTNFTTDVISGTTGVTAPIILGRSPYSFFEQGNGSAFGGNNIAFNDVAIFYKALSPSVITNLYVTGAGLTVNGVLDQITPGNLLLTYPLGTLQSAPDVRGPYTDVPGATSPCSIPMTNTASFFRARF